MTAADERLFSVGADISGNGELIVVTPIGLVCRKALITHEEYSRDIFTAWKRR